MKWHKAVVEKTGYRVEEMHPCGWCMIRNHDDEPMSIYGTEKEAIAALKGGDNYAKPQKKARNK